jgi:SAM-dependent methyltransferase
MEITDYKKRWNKKPVLRAVYADIYQYVETSLIDGNTLEIGSGIGNFKIKNGDLIKTDVQFSIDIDVVSDAQRLPFSNESFSNIVLVDVVHHLECPLLFFAEAQRILKGGGRIIMIDPGITPFSWFFYRFLHAEPVDMKWNPAEECSINPNKDPYDSNQAIPTLLFGKYLKFFKDRNPSLILLEYSWMSIFIYQLSGGFQAWSLIPYKFVHHLLRIERYIQKIFPLLSRIIAFRLKVVLEKEK